MMVSKQFSDIFSERCFEYPDKWVPCISTSQKLIPSDWAPLCVHPVTSISLHSQLCYDSQEMPWKWTLQGPLWYFISKSGVRTFEQSEGAAPHSIPFHGLSALCLHSADTYHSSSQVASTRRKNRKKKNAMSQASCWILAALDSDLHVVQKIRWLEESCPSLGRWARLNINLWNPNTGIETRPRNTLQT